MKMAAFLCKAGHLSQKITNPSSNLFFLKMHEMKFYFEIKFEIRVKTSVYRPYASVYYGFLYYELRRLNFSQKVV